MKVFINSLGIALSSIGAFLVWRYLGKLNFSQEQEYLQGRGVLEIPNPTPEDVKKFKQEKCLSKAGLFLILLGGLLQIISNYLNA